MSFRIHTFFVAVICYSAWVASSTLVNDPVFIPTLTAIKTRSDIEKRDVNFAPKYDCEHHYADHESLQYGGITRFAKTSMQYKLPAVALEEIESHVEKIECSQTAITIDFDNVYIYEQAKSEWDQYSEFFIISSHPGCNDDGDRAPYLISRVDYPQHGLAAVFSSRRIEWNEAYAKMTVNFGMSQGQDSEYTFEGLRFHNSLGRRASGAASTTIVPSSPNTISIPTPTPAVQSSNHSINFSSTNPDITSFTASKNVSGVTVSGTASLGCKKCSISGSIQIIEGNFTVDGGASSEIATVNQIIHHGYLFVVVNGFTADIELLTTVKGSISDGFTFTFLTVPIGAFQIPGIATVGPVFTASLLGNIDLSASMDFTYGFQLKVPDNSSIFLDIGSLENSTSSGFSNSTITPIPFQASTPAFDLSLSLGLQPELSIDVDILSGKGSVKAGIYFDLPSVGATISQISSVDSKCESASPSTFDGSLHHIFPNLTHIVPTVAIDIGLDASAAVNVDIIDLVIATGTSVQLAGTTFTLPTVCLSFNAANGVFTSPTVTSSSSSLVILAPTVSATATGSGTGERQSQKQSAGRSRGADNPFKRGDASSGSRLWCMVTELVTVLAVAITL